MKLWPFNRLEKRQDSYTDVLVSLLTNRASGKGSDAKTGAVESCQGFWERAFAVAKVVPSDTPASRALDAFTLASMGRGLCKNGEWLAEITVDDAGALYLDIADSWNVTGDGPPYSWEYELSFDRPSGSVTRMLPAGRVVHVRLPNSGPIKESRTTVSLLGNLESKLEAEFSGPVGLFVACSARSSRRPSQRCEEPRGGSRCS